MATIKDTSTVARKSVDLEVYQRDTAASRIDWQKQASKITTAVDNIYQDRQKRKSKLEKSFRKQQEALSDMGDYTNQQLQQLAITGGQTLGMNLAEANALMKKGIITVNDYNLAHHNIKSGAKSFKNLASIAEAEFKITAERTSKDENAIQERNLMSSVMGYANINNLRLVSDMSNAGAQGYGVVGLMRTDDEGTPVEGETKSLAEINNRFRQKINKFKIEEALTEKVDTIGTRIISEIEQRGYTVRNKEIEYNKLTNPDVMKLEADAMLTDPQHQLDLALRLAEGGTKYGKTPGGKAYEDGTRDEHDALDAKLKKEGKGLEYNNIIIFEDNGTGLHVPDLSDEQYDNIRDYTAERLKNQLDDSETVKVKILYPGGRGGSGNNPTKQSGAKAQRLVTVLDSIDPSVSPEPAQIADAEAQMNDMLTDVNEDYTSEYDAATNTWTIINPTITKDVSGITKGLVKSAPVLRENYTKANGGIVAVIDMNNPANIKSFSGVLYPAGTNRTATQLMLDDFNAVKLGQKFYGYAP